MRYVLETITPAKARSYLEKNTCNRKVRSMWVHRLARDISSGKWVPNHQGIAFDTDGKLSDGQHRLMAVVEAGIPVQMWVAHGEPCGARLTIDQNGPRTVVDISGPLVGIDGGVEKDDASCARQMYCSVSRSNFTSGQSLQERLEYILKHYEAIRFACDNLRAPSVRHACFRAVIARAWYTQDRDRIVAFCEILASGIAARAEDIAPARLRSYWLANKDRFNGAGGRATLYRKTEMALRAFLARRCVDKIVEVESEIFPLDDDADRGDS